MNNGVTMKTALEVNISTLRKHYFNTMTYRNINDFACYCHDLFTRKGYIVNLNLEQFEALLKDYMFNLK